MTTFRSALAIAIAAMASAFLADAACAVTLTVTKAGSGSGTVVSNAGGISCGAGCSSDYPNGTSITLTRTASAGSQFTGWLGPCTGTGACQFTIGGPTTAVATFASPTITGPMLDIDGSGDMTAPTDGLLVLRHLFGLSGASLLNNAVGPSASRTGPQITAYLNDIKPALDVDGDGAADALTDGPIVIRYLFGLRDTSLIGGAVASGARRTLASDIEAQASRLTLASSFPSNPIAAASYTRGNPFTLNDSTTTSYIYGPTTYDTTHNTPTTLFVWLHGCGGLASGDIWSVSPGGTQS